MDKGNDETLSRLRRIETRLTRLCLHMNADVLGDKPKIRIEQEATRPVLVIPGLDTGIGECLQFCREQGVEGEIRLVYNGADVGSIDVRESQ